MSLPTDYNARKALPIFSYQMEYFPDAFLAEVEVAVVGNDQHNPGQPLHWAREKSKDHMNCAARHQFDHGRGITKDTDGTYHLAKAIWRLKAELQLTIERERAAEPTDCANTDDVVLVLEPVQDLTLEELTEFFRGLDAIRSKAGY